MQINQKKQTNDISLSDIDPESRNCWLITSAYVEGARLLISALNNLGSCSAIVIFMEETKSVWLIVNTHDHEQHFRPN